MGIVEREYGPFEGVDRVLGVSFDGERVWYATGTAIHAMDPKTGALTDRIDVPADAGTAFDGRYLYQLAEDRIQKIDPKTRAVVHTIPAPCGDHGSGMAWAEGSLWVGEYRGGKIHRVDPETGEVLSTIESKRWVTGVTWADGNLWHGAKQDDEMELRRIDPATGEVEERIPIDEPIMVTGVAPAGDGRFFCGGGNDGKVRLVRK